LKGGVVFSILAFVLLDPLLWAGESSKAEVFTPGVSWIGERGIRQSTAEIMQREARNALKKRDYRLHKRRFVEFVEYVEEDELPPPDQPNGPPPELASSGQTA